MSSDLHDGLRHFLVIVEVTETQSYLRSSQVLQRLLARLLPVHHSFRVHPPRILAELPSLFEARKTVEEVRRDDTDLDSHLVALGLTMKTSGCSWSLESRVHLADILARPSAYIIYMCCL